MKALTLVILLAAIGCASSTTQTAKTSEPAAPAPIPQLITESKQLTFEGARAGESYFSRDGRYMIFQSEREPGNPFYQIYLMDTKEGSTRRISPGQGKTTCSWIAPDNKHILFASTHADPDLKKKTEAEFESRKHPKSKYAWSFDDTFEIYATDFNGKNIKNLTNSPGYDAEGSYSPDGKWIAFASNRLGYTAPLPEGAEKLFKQDPSVMMDIYIMRADGTQVKRLTTDLGYDGGPFFSPDGKRIIYRHFSPNGITAEVMTMNIDGSEPKQITRMNAMSWAPFYHPSGDYIIFTTNKQGFHNFELYITDVDGLHEPVRVTSLEGFDGLPVFTPDGGNLVWAHANEHGEGQIYRAKWDDSGARKILGLKPAAPRVDQLNAAIDPRDARTWIEYLASEHLQGRPTGTEQEQEYLGTIAKAFANMGLSAWDKTYLQKYEFTSGVDLDPGTALELTLGSSNDKPTVGNDWTPLSYSKAGSFGEAPVVFVGYGIVAPEGAGQPGYDSYAGADVKGKWAVAFSGLPDQITNERRFFLHTYSRLQHKAMMARTRGAAGLIIVEDSISPSPLMKLVYEGRSEDAGLPVIRLSPALADKLFAAAGATRTEWTTKLAKGETFMLEMPKAKLKADINLRLKKSSAQNALGFLKVPGATSTVIIGAHGDHLGYGEAGNSLYRGEKAVHYGADDNASGVAGVMEIAQDLAQKVKSKQITLKQNVLFAVWTGEEIGILGSNYFINSVPTKAREQFSAYINLDMIGRLRENLLVQGVGSAPEWKSLIEKVNSQGPMNIKMQEDPYLPSDALTFYMKQIPIVFLFTGSHPEYHTPKDKPDLINYEGLARTAGWAERLIQELAKTNRRMVTYKKVEHTQRPGEGRGFRLYLGTVPDYSQDGKGGVVISGTGKDSPAEKAGLKAGDMIIELGGMKIQNLHDYVYCLQALKANERTKLRVKRGNEEKELEIVPVLKVQ